MKVIIAIALVAGLCVPSPRSVAQTSHVSGFKTDQNAFLLQVKAAADGVKMTSTAIKCGLVTKVAMHEVLSTYVDALLLAVKSSYGNDQGDLSYAGTSEFYRAVSGIYALADREQLAGTTPSPEQCKTVTDSGFLQAINRIHGS